VKRKRTEITIEVDEVTQVTVPNNRLISVWCTACGAETTMVTPGQAARIKGVTVRRINRWVESDLVHFVETEDGFLLVCVNSLSQKTLPEA